MKRQEADVGGLDAHPDLFYRCLRKNIRVGNSDRENQKQQGAEHHRPTSEATPLL